MTSVSTAIGLRRTLFGVVLALAALPMDLSPHKLRRERRSSKIGA